MQRVMSKIGLFAVSTLGLSCSWFEQPKPCAQGTSTCDGDRVRRCVYDEQASLDEGDVVTHWSTIMTCSDDPELGPYTCARIDGQAKCVPETSGDAGGESPAASAAGAWVRLAVQPSGDSVQIAGVESFDLDSAPPKPAAGGVAAVSYRGGELVDATLIPFDDGQEVAYAWVNGEDVDRIAIVDASGQVLTSVDVAQGVASLDNGVGGDLADAGIDGGAVVVADRPDGGQDGVGSAGRRAVRVIARYGKREFPLSSEFYQLASTALSRVPDALMVLAPTAVLELDQATAQMLAGAEPVPPTLEEVLNGSGATGSTRALWYSGSQLLVIDMRADALAEYRASTLALSVDIVSALVGKYVQSTSELAKHEGPLKALFGTKLPSDFPSQLVPFLNAQYAGLLEVGESPVSAWGALHGVAVSAKLASPYEDTFGASPSNDEEAVRFGFAAGAGAASAAADLTEYVVRAAVPELWTTGPCSELGRVPLDVVDPPLLVHAAKLLALRGLQLLRAEAFGACVGELRISSAQSGGAIVLHKPDGERVTYTEDLEGIRQPYYRDEVRLSWNARRKYMGVSLGAGYRGVQPTVMRLAPVGAEEGSESGAVFAATDPDGYQTAVARGGLFVVTQATPHKLEAFALMVPLSAEQVGTKVLPLISAQVSEPDWEDAL